MMIYFLTIIWAGLIFFGSSIPSANLPGPPDNISILAHFFEYLVLGGLLFLSFKKLSKENKRVILVLVIGIIYAFSDETHQLFVSGRHFDLMDILVDFFGLAMGIGVVLLRYKFNIVKYR